MIKVLVVDDHSIVREGLVSLIELEDNFQIVGSASSGEECLTLVKEENPDVILLDINMTGMSGLQVLKKLRADNCKSKIVMLTIHDEPEILASARSLGCDGYILKDSDFVTVKNAITETYEGREYIDKNMLSFLTQEPIQPVKLTKREKEILGQISNGMSNKEIAAVYKLSEKTVKNHISNLFKKIGVKDRTQAAVYALKRNGDI